MSRSENIAKHSKSKPVLPTRTNRSSLSNEHQRKIVDWLLRYQDTQRFSKYLTSCGIFGEPGSDLRRRAESRRKYYDQLRKKKTPQEFQFILNSVYNTPDSPSSVTTSAPLSEQVKASKPVALPLSERNDAPKPVVELLSPKSPSTSQAVLPTIARGKNTIMAEHLCPQVKTAVDLDFDHPEKNEDIWPFRAERNIYRGERITVCSFLLPVLDLRDITKVQVTLLENGKGFKVKQNIVPDSLMTEEESQLFVNKKLIAQPKKWAQLDTSDVDQAAGVLYNLGMSFLSFRHRMSEIPPSRFSERTYKFANGEKARITNLFGNDGTTVKIWPNVVPFEFGKAKKISYAGVAEWFIALDLPVERVVLAAEDKWQEFEDALTGVQKCKIESPDPPVLKQSIPSSFGLKSPPPAAPNDASSSSQTPLRKPFIFGVKSPPPAAQNDASNSSQTPLRTPFIFGMTSKPKIVHFSPTFMAAPTAAHSSPEARNKEPKGNRITYCSPGRSYVDKISAFSEAVKNYPSEKKPKADRIAYCSPSRSYLQTGNEKVSSSSDVVKNSSAEKKPKTDRIAYCSPAGSYLQTRNEKDSSSDFVKNSSADNKTEDNRITSSPEKVSSSQKKPSVEDDVIMEDASDDFQNIHGDPVVPFPWAESPTASSQTPGSVSKRFEGLIDTPTESYSAGKVQQMCKGWDEKNKHKYSDPTLQRVFEKTAAISAYMHRRYQEEIEAEKLADAVQHVPKRLHYTPQECGAKSGANKALVSDHMRMLHFPHLPSDPVDVEEYIISQKREAAKKNLADPLAPKAPTISAEENIVTKKAVAFAAKAPLLAAKDVGPKDEAKTQIDFSSSDDEDDDYNFSSDEEKEDRGDKLDYSADKEEEDDENTWSSEKSYIEEEITFVEEEVDEQEDVDESAEEVIEDAEAIEVVQPEEDVDLEDAVEPAENIIEDEAIDVVQSEEDVELEDVVEPEEDVELEDVVEPAEEVIQDEAICVVKPVDVFELEDVVKPAEEEVIEDEEAIDVTQPGEIVEDEVMEDAEDDRIGNILDISSPQSKHESPLTTDGADDKTKRLMIATKNNSWDSLGLGRRSFDEYSNTSPSHSPSKQGSIEKKEMEDVDKDFVEEIEEEAETAANKRLFAPDPEETGRVAIAGPNFSKIGPVSPKNKSPSKKCDDDQQSQSTTSTRRYPARSNRGRKPRIED